MDRLRFNLGARPFAWDMANYLMKKSRIPEANPDNAHQVTHLGLEAGDPPGGMNNAILQSFLQSIDPGDVFEDLFLEEDDSSDYELPADFSPP